MAQPASASASTGNELSVDPLSGADQPDKALLHRLLAVPEFKQKYLGYVRDLSDKWLDWNRIGPLARRYHDLIADDVHRDTHKLYSNEAFDASLEGSAGAGTSGGAGAGGGFGGGPFGFASLSLRSFVEQRHAYLATRVGSISYGAAMNTARRAALWLACLGASQAAFPASPPTGCPGPPLLPSYYANSQLDLTSLLPPPPAPGSAEQQADLEGVLAAQRAARANGTVARALADTEQTCARFKDVLGPALKSAPAAHALQFISQAAMSASLANASLKRYWKRPRPFIASDAVQRLGDVAPGGESAHDEYPDKYCVEPSPKDESDARKRQAKRDKEEHLRDYTSYPSGHAAYGMACAVLLSAAVPEKRGELFARARQYGESRLIVGAHYPSDVAAGQQAAQLGAAWVMQNVSFGRQFAVAQSELRAVLACLRCCRTSSPTRTGSRRKTRRPRP